MMVVMMMITLHPFNGSCVASVTLCAAALTCAHSLRACADRQLRGNGCSNFEVVDSVAPPNASATCGEVRLDFVTDMLRAHLETAPVYVHADSAQAHTQTRLRS